MNIKARLTLLALAAAVYNTAAAGAFCRSYTPAVKTVVATVGENWLSPPVMTLGSDEVLYVSFDEMSHNYHRYICHVEHCEADWSVSEGIFESDYLNGLNDNPIDDYRNSLNTTQMYTHYSFSLPNDRCSLKMSGNYRLRILDEDNDGACVAEVRFMVVEPLTAVGLSATTNTDVDHNQRHQQVSVGVDYRGLQVNNVDEEVMLVVMQNGNEDGSRRGVRPNLMSQQGLTWQHNRDLIFDAGNEYHKYEILDVTHTTMGLDHISWDGRWFNVWPIIDEPRNNYLYDVDANGSFFIRNSDNREIDYTCDYVNVHYRLKVPEQQGADVIIDGHWTTDADSSQYTMTWDPVFGGYTATTIQKQGYYSYRYLLRGSDGRLTQPPFEGSFYQTENRYQALVYYKKTGDRTWRIVGYRELVFK